MDFIHTKTKKEYDYLMELFDSYGWKWNSGLLPKEGFHWNEYGRFTLVAYNKRIIYKHVTDILQYKGKNSYNVILFSDFYKTLTLKKINVRKELNI